MTKRRLSRNLEQSLHRALGNANERRHEYATLEHLLLALVDDQDATAVLRACGVDLERLRRDITHYLDHDLAGLVTRHGSEAKPTEDRRGSAEPSEVIAVACARI